MPASPETEATGEPRNQAANAADEDEVFAFPTSFAQQRLWFLDQVDPGTSVYNIPQAFELRGPLRIELIERALQEIVRRHEALRTTFGSTDGTPLQLVTASLHLPFPSVDLRHLPQEERLAEAQRLADEEAREPFHLDKGPLLRASVLVLGDEHHVLLLNVHHIVCDGWSLALLFHEVSELYRAFAADQPSPLPEIPIQYPDYTLWQRDWLKGEELERQLAYWREKLGGELPVLELPGDRGRPPLQSFEGGWIKFHLSKELTDGLAALARREGISLYMTLLGAFKVLLHRLSGQPEILVGSPIANRDRSEIENAIGFYTNTVVFRTDLSGGPTFRSVLGRIKENALGVYTNQDVPLDKIVDAVHPSRGAGHNPLFQVMFGFQKAPEAALAIAGVQVTPLVVHSATSKFDLLVEMQEIAAGMQCFLEYSRDLFDDPTAARFITHFRTLLEGIVRDPELSVDELPLLTEAERHQILIEWNATRADYPETSCLHDLVSAQATRTPEAIALEFEAETLTYGELDRRSKLLARHLRSLGVGPDVLVGIFVERSIEMMVGLLGILHAGGAYLPLDPSFPPDRVAYMLSDAQAPVILTQERLVSSLPAHTATQVLLDADWERIEKGGTGDGGESSGRRAGPEDLVYMIYTSGSTGKPKGVQIPHRAVVNFLTSMSREPGFTAADRLLAVTTLSFDIAGLELYLPLIVGGTVILASRDLVGNGPELLAKLKASAITVLQATPATFRMLLEAAGNDDSAPQTNGQAGSTGWEGPSKLKILCGGEAWPASLATQLLERSASLWNMYGPTETTIWSTCSRVTDPDTLVIGTPIANTRTYVLDHKLQPVPIGVTGELHIGGDGLARGYFNRPELNQEKFIADPFGEEPGARLYKTGDLARFLPGGALQYLQRSDNQVKVRGFRIELGEIEAGLAQHPAVRQPVVAVREDSTGDKRIVAYVVYQPVEVPTASELRKFLRGLLPDYMVPHLFVELEALPLTGNGKIDRRALPDPFQSSAAPSEEHVAPRTAMEEFVAEVWREVLKLDRVGLRDNFFDLGGHSLLSMQVVYRIEKKTGRKLNPRSMVFQNLEQIAAECGGNEEGEPAGSAAKSALPATSAAVAAIPASPSQERTAAPPAPPPEPAKPLARRLFDALKSKVIRS